MAITASDLEPILPRLVDLRRDLHKHPELGFEERRTQAVVRAWLEEHGYEPRACAGTGLIADLHPGATEPAIALRADLDALAIPERTDLPWRSTRDGVAHKCGHDGHVAILCGVAAVLASRKRDVSRNVRLLFQPAEEGVNGGGARVMIGAGALEGVGEVYGLHNWPAFPKGEVRVAVGATMAGNVDFDLRLVGRGGHGAEPQRCRDPIAAGAQVVVALQSLIARGLGLEGGAVASVTSFQAGSTNNVIPGEARLLGTLRCVDESLSARLSTRLRAAIEGVAASSGVRAELTLRQNYPPLINDADCVAVVRRAAAAVVGADRVSADALPLAAAEDFAFFARERPSAYFFLGAGIEGEDTPGCHHPDFDFDDELIPLGVRILVGVVEQ